MAPAHSDGARAGLGPAFRLLNCRQLICLGWLILERIAVGCCDLLLAAALYMLFLRLQGSFPTNSLRLLPASILSIAAATSALVVVRTLLDTLSTRFASRQIQALHKDFLSRLSLGYSGMRWERFVERNRSELLNHAVHTAEEAADFYQRCVEMIASAVVVVIMIAVLVYQSPKAAAGMGSAVILFYGVHRLLIRRRLQLAAFTREQALRTLQRNLADMLSSGKEIRTYRHHQFFLDRIGEQADRVAASNHRILLLPQITGALADQGVVFLFLCIVIGVQLQHGDMRQLLSLLVFYFALSRRLLPLLSQIFLIAGQMEGSYENVRIIDSELRDCLAFHDPVAPVSLPGDDLALELSQVSFSFHESVPILRDISICLRKAEVMVLRGASGSGKSSLLNVIAGVSQAATGVVRVDRGRIAYVPQEVPLLDATIRNNLIFGLAGKSDADLMKALAVAKLEEFVISQPLGLETCIGDNGILFSGGERQRLGLARAILRNATLLLLDEATSALDVDNERQVLDNLRAAGIAILLVTHRAHTQPFGQRQFQLQDGYLIEELPEPCAGNARVELSAALS
jgi:ABC-type multidrug transport system fused ATPase/permease subunit